MLLLHDDALGFFDDLAFGESALRVLELVAQCAIRLEARLGDLEDGLEALRLHAGNDVGSDSRLDCSLYGVAVAVVGEHNDRPRIVAAYDDDLLEHVARRRIRVDDDHVRAHCTHAFQQRGWRPFFSDNLIACHVECFLE